MASSSFMKLNGCCFCFSLRTGTLAILWFNMIYYVLVMTSLSMTLHRKYTNESAWEYFAAALYFESVLILGFLPSFSALYYGVYKKKTEYLQYVIALGVFFTAIMIIVFSAIFYMYLNRAELLQSLLDQLYRRSDANADVKVPSAGVFTLSWFIGVSFASLIQWYFTSVIYNYYLQLKEELRPYSAGYSASPKV